MKKIISLTLIAITTFVMTVSISSCCKGEDIPNPVTPPTPEVIKVQSITFDQTALSLVPGGTATLTPQVLPSDANNKALTWTSSDVTVATVDQSGKVTAVAVGNATITATAVDGSGVIATCPVSVGTQGDTGTGPAITSGGTTEDPGFNGTVDAKPGTVQF